MDKSSIFGSMKYVDISLLAKYVGLSVISKGERISPLKLQKLLYYIQSWHMVLMKSVEERLFEDVPEAWVNGPVYPSIYKEYKGKVNGMCDYLSSSDFGANQDEDILDAISKIYSELGLNVNQARIIDSVITLYGTKSQNELIFMTHSEKPWSEARGNLLPFEKSENKISLETMYSYYKERYDRNRRPNA